MTLTIGCRRGETVGTWMISSADAAELFGVAVGEGDDHAVARLDLLHVALHLLEDLVAGRDRHHRHVLVDQRDRAVLHLARGVALGVDVGDLLELERAFEGDRVVDAAPQVEEVLAPGSTSAPAPPCAPPASGSPRRPPAAGGRGRRGTCALELSRRAPGADRGQQVERHQLGGERLGRGDADLRAGVGVDHALADRASPGCRARCRSVNRRAPRSRAASMADERVRRLARLGDADREHRASDDRVAVAVLGAVVHLDRHAGELLDQELADQPGVPGGAAGQRCGCARSARAPPRRSSPCRTGSAASSKSTRAGEGVLHGLGLLVDLLEHEVLVAALLGLDRDPS